MLNGTLTLHDIRDVEAFCTTILDRRGLNGPDREDLLTYLIEETWRLSGLDQHLKPISGHPRPWTRSFSGWIRPLLQLRLIDHVRRTNGDWRYHTGRLRHHYQHIPLDDPLVGTLTTSPLDDPTHSDTALLRQLRNRDRTHDTPYKIMGTRPTRRAA